MKIALIALPQSDEVAAAPLPFAYTAALLEQQRHLVRIYDLAVRGSSPHGSPLASLHTFRPHLVLIATPHPSAALEVERRAAECGAAIVHVGLGMREWAGGQAAARALRPAQHGVPPSKDEQNVIIDALLALDDDLDTLPFPARHLLPLEQYPTYTPSGALQTPLLVGRHTAGGHQLRTPALLVSELRSVAHEHAMLHVLLAGAPLTCDEAWLDELLLRLDDARLGVSWEGSVAYERLTTDLLRRCRHAGCETLDFTFDAMAVLDARDARVALTEAVRQAHELEITVRARISLEPRYSSVPALVDMAGTFGLDDVRFHMQPYTAAQAAAQAGQMPLAEIAELVRVRYQSSRSRQYFVNRFGERLGPLMWRMGRTGLLGAAMREQALGGVAASEVVAEG